MTEELTASVIIPTYRRPGYVRSCLEHLSRLRTSPLEVIVVDASPDDETRDVVGEYHGVRYLRNELGARRTPESRGIGLDHARGDVVAFVDDDAFVAEDWLDEILAQYTDPEVAGVGGRILNGTSGEEHEGLDRIGRLLPDGQLTGSFTADPGRAVTVDHLLGANMSFRRKAVLDVGGVHGRYPGPCICEETDISLRQRALGRRLVYTPRAVVRHVSAPYAIRGDRFDRRWHYYAARNHMAMLVRVFGPTSQYVGRYALTVTKEAAWSLRTLARALALAPRGEQRGRIAPLGAVLRAGIGLAGAVVGLAAGLGIRGVEQRGSGTRA